MQVILCNASVSKLSKVSFNQVLYTGPEFGGHLVFLVLFCNHECFANKSFDFL